MASLTTSLLTLLFTSALTATSPSPYGTFTNLNCIRTINLKEPQVLKETISVVIQNNGEDKLGKYYFTLGEAKNGTLAGLAAQTKAEKLPLLVKLEKFDEKTKQQYYSVTLSPPLRPEGKVVFNFKLSFLRAVVPYPESTLQTQGGNFKYLDNLYFTTPYPTTTHKTVVKMGVPKLVDYTQDSTLDGFNDNTLTYGPHSSLPSHPYKELMVHFPHYSPILYVRSLFRDLEVSHWGNNLAVEEHYAVDNYGPKFKGSFSRTMHSVLEYQKMTNGFVKFFDFTLPAHATDGYFRDEIGNVSTSNFRSGKQSSHLRVEPRYPLYGGWNYTWYHGYNLPLASSLKHLVSDPTQFTLTVPLLDSLSKSPVLDFTFRVVLPEGATDVKIGSLNLDDYQLEHGRIFTYLDTVGRPTVTLHRRNVIKQHWVPIEIHYTYHPTAFLRKPFAVFVPLTLCFALAMLISRVNLHLGSSQHKKQK